MIWDENLKALRAVITADCTAEMAKTHGVDPAELAKRLPGGRMEQMKIEPARCVEARKRNSRSNSRTAPPQEPLSTCIQQQSMDPDGP